LRVASRINDGFYRFDWPEHSAALAIEIDIDGADFARRWSTASD
jgi:hypothetical protein